MGRAEARWFTQRRTASRPRRRTCTRVRIWALGRGNYSVWYSAVVRALGIDYGERRIGLALSDVTGLLASPWKTVPHAANIRLAAQQLVDEVKDLQLQEGGLNAIVI